MSIVRILQEKSLLNPPKFIKHNIQYETRMGSIAYGTAVDSSDIDIYGFCIPPKDVVFPHQYGGEIEGFGRQKKRFEQYQQHHIKDPDTSKEYDLNIYNIVKYFTLLMENNPNILDSLFTPLRCITHSTQVGNIVRENRHMFLHKGSYYKHKGYAFSQLHKIGNVGRSQEVSNIRNFEKEHKIPHTTTLEDVKKEITRRNGIQIS